MSRGESGFHVRLRESNLKRVDAAYPGVTLDQVWRVEVVNGGYGRDAMHLLLVDKVGGEPVLVEGEPKRIVVWRGQVVGAPRCDYCGAEGHSASTGTAATCSVRAAEVAQQREASSRRMTERWNRMKAEAAVMLAEQAAFTAGMEEDRAEGREARGLVRHADYPPEWDQPHEDPVTYRDPLPDTDGPEAA